MIGVLSDAHGNAEAFDVGVALLAAEGATQIRYLGDAVGYLPGGAVVDRLLTEGIAAVRGNHEQMLLDRDTRGRDRHYRLAATRLALRPEALRAIETWPVSDSSAYPAGPAIRVHGSPLDPLWGHVYPDTDLTPLTGLGWAYVFMGHTHRPFVRTAGGTTFINVGSCGLPRDRGDLGCACLFDETSGEIALVRFDITAPTRRALRRVGPVSPLVLDTFGKHPREGR